jgi:hypothetical protein
MRTDLLRLDPRRVATTLGIVALALVIVHIVAMQIIFNGQLSFADRHGIEYWHLSVLDLDEEESFGTWFSSGILFFAGLLLLGRARVLRASGGRAVGWLTLGFGFLFLSMDEVVALHELVNTLMEDTEWTLIGFPILIAVGVGFIPFLRGLPRRTALLFIVAGAIYGGGAVGVEHFTDDAVNSLHYNMWTALEEGMEMGGVILFIFALLDFRARDAAT